MSSLQKIIKYLAIAFAVFICFMIFSGIMMAITIVFGITGVYEEGTTQTGLYVETREFEQIENLEIKVETSKLIITQGDSFKVEVEGRKEDISTTVNGNTLKIKEKGHWPHIFNEESYTKITIYIPEDISLRKVKIENGAGNATIGAFQTRSLDINMGVGTFLIDGKVIAQNVEIDGGAGKLEIRNCDFTNLDLDGGVGSTYINGILRGSSKIDCGVGKLELSLQGEAQDYRITTKTGLGNIYLNNDKCQDGNTYGQGKNAIRINGGVGSTYINLTEVSNPIKEEIKYE